MDYTKLICFDFDGTLVQPGEIIHHNDVEILNAAFKYPFLLATGRGLPSIRGTFAKNSLFIDSPIPFPIIAQNGAVIYNKNEVLLKKFSFPQRVFQSLLVLLDEFPDVIFYIFETNMIHLLHPNLEAIRSAEYYSMPVDFQNEFADMSINKILASSSDPDELQQVSKKISHLDVESYLSLSNLLEITPKGVNKASGFEHLIFNLNHKPKFTYVAGDGENDLPLFKKADFSFAPSHSIEKVRMIADHIIDVKNQGLLPTILRFAGLL